MAHVGHAGHTLASMITKTFILAKENTLISTKILRDHGGGVAAGRLGSAGVDRDERVDGRSLHQVLGGRAERSFPAI